MKKMYKFILILTIVFNVICSNSAFAESYYPPNYIPSYPDLSPDYISYTQGDIIKFEGIFDTKANEIVCGLAPINTSESDFYTDVFFSSVKALKLDKFSHMGEVSKTEVEISDDQMHIMPGEYQFMETTIVSSLNTANVQPGSYRFYVFILYGGSARVVHFYQDVEILPTIIPTTSTIFINNEQVSFQAYMIDNNNYFKLRDIAYALNGTNKQFEVTWNDQNNLINLISSKPYSIVGGEMTMNNTDILTPKLINSKMILDSTEKTLAAYLIGNNNYFKLRDIGKMLDFSIKWDENSNSILINTTESYSDDL
nr:hypothetical protein [Sedimentibacter sp.]